MSEASDQLVKQALQARREGRLADAKRDLLQAVEICRRSGSRAESARALKDLGQIECDLDNYDAALQHYEESLALYRAEGDVLKIAHTVRHVGDIHRYEGRLELAEQCYLEALSLYRSDPRTPQLDLANAIRPLAILKFDAGETEEARSLWEETRKLYAAVNVEAGVAESSRWLALLAQK